MVLNSLGTVVPQNHLVPVPHGVLELIYLVLSLYEGNFYGRRMTVVLPIVIGRTTVNRN